MNMNMESTQVQSQSTQECCGVYVEGEPAEGCSSVIISPIFFIAVYKGLRNCIADKLRRDDGDIHSA